MTHLVTMTRSEDEDRRARQETDNLHSLVESDDGEDGKIQEIPSFCTAPVRHTDSLIFFQISWFREP